MSKLLFDEPPLQVQRTLACFIGLNEAMILQQLHYIIDQSKLGQTIDGVRWIRMTIPEWGEIFPFFDDGQIKRALKNLQEDGLLLGQAFDGLGRSKWYTIAYDKVASLSGPVERLSSRQTKRQKAAKISVDSRNDYKKVSVQNVPIVDSNRTKCSEVSVQNVPTIGTKCSASKNTSKNTSKNISKEIAATPPPGKTIDSDQTPEAVKVYRSVARRYPDKSTWLEIGGTVGGEPSDLEFWRDVVAAYIRCGWNKLNVDGMLKFYRDRRIPTTEKVTAQKEIAKNAPRSRFAGEIPEDNIVKQLSQPGAYRL